MICLDNLQNARKLAEEGFVLFSKNDSPSSSFKKFLLGLELAIWTRLAEMRLLLHLKC